MKELCVRDDMKEHLAQQGISLQAWMYEQLQAQHFDLQRPVHYRYDAALHQTRIYQYEYGPERSPYQTDFDADFLDMEAWDRACELLLQDTETYHQHLTPKAPKKDDASCS